VLRNLLGVRDNCVGFFIFEFLKEAEYEVEDEKDLNEVVCQNLINVDWISESSVECLRESVHARCNQHESVKPRLPLAVYPDHELVHEVLLIIDGLLLLLHILFLSVKVSKQFFFLKELATFSHSWFGLQILGVAHSRDHR
jgi:hypothetical protein